MGGLGKMIGNTFKNKKVLITGHTGFKGSWLTIWLLKLGAKVVGISDSIKTDPSMFCAVNLQDKINHKICDIRNYENFKQIIENEKPDFITPHMGIFNDSNYCHVHDMLKFYN